MNKVTSARPYLVVEWSGGGGLGHYAFLLADALATRGGEVTLVTRRGHDLEAAPHAPRTLTPWPRAPKSAPGISRRLRIGVGRTQGWLTVCRLVAESRKRRPTVHLQSVDQPAEIIFGAILRALGATVIVTVHNARPHDAGMLKRLVQTLGLRVPNGFIAHTQTAAEEVVRVRGVLAPVRVLPHPSYRPLVELASSSVVAPTGPLRVGAFGMIRPYKGLEFVVEVVRDVRARGIPVELRVAGRAASPPWVLDTLGALPEDAVSHRLEYLPLTDLVNEVKRSDVLLLGHRSLSESGIAQLALGAGVAVVGPRMGALERLLAPRPDWLFEPEDHEGAVRRLAVVLERLSEDRTSMRSAAYELAAAAPEWDDMAGVALSLADDASRPRPRPGHERARSGEA